MQKDYVGMMQGQQPTQETPKKQLTQEEFQDIEQNFQPLNDEDFEALGMTPGNTPEAVKARIVELLERFGVFDEFSASDKMEFFQQIDIFVQDMISGNIEAAQQSPVSGILDNLSAPFEALNDQEAGLDEVMLSAQQRQG